MIIYAIDRLKHMNYSEVIIWVLAENIRARNFYEKFNFIFDGAKKKIEIGKPFMEIRYALTI